MAIKFSEAIRHLDISKFERKDQIKNDAERYCRENNINIGGVNYIALRLSFGNTITTHMLTDGVVAKIRNTTICNMPNEMPAFLTKPFIIEARHDNVLFDNIVCLAGYLSEGGLFLIAIFSDGSSLIQHEVCSYDGRRIQDINYYAYGACTFTDPKRKDTFAFATVFSLLLEADRTPFAIDDKITRDSGNSRINRNIKQNESDWIEKRIYIDKKYTPKYKYENSEQLDIEGKVLKDIYVHGFLRHQAYGPEHSLRKWVYVEGFDSTRWSKPGDTKIIVDMYEKA